MKCRWFLFPWPFLILIFMNGCVQSDEFSGLKGPYLGQEPPGMTPEIFAPGVVSTDKDEINSVFSSNGAEFYFSRDTYRDDSQAGRAYTILFMTEQSRGWTKPQVVSFAGEYMNGDMFMSGDDERLFFCSDRPLDGKAPRKADSDIWFVQRKGEGWAEPENLGPEVNTNSNEWYPSLTQSGTLYFSSSREGGHGGSDIYTSRLENGSYKKAVNLGTPVSSRFGEGDVFVAPDDSYLIVVSVDRSGGYGSGDLYIAFRKDDGSWSEPRNMGEPINSSALEYCPIVSPDGKYLFFTSRRRGTDDIYWMDAKVIEEFQSSLD